MRVSCRTGLRGQPWRLCNPVKWIMGPRVAQAAPILRSVVAPLGARLAEAVDDDVAYAVKPDSGEGM
jgi:hypothetical protein